MKTAIFKVILPTFIEEKYWTIGDFSVNIYQNPILPIFQIKVIFVSNILGFQNDTKLPAALNLQASDIGSGVKNYRKGPTIQKKVIQKQGG